jgi:hypothetical protein
MHQWPELPHFGRRLPRTPFRKGTVGYETSFVSAVSMMISWAQRWITGPAGKRYFEVPARRWWQSQFLVLDCSVDSSIMEPVKQLVGSSAISLNLDSEKTATSRSSGLTAILHICEWP